MELNGLKAAFLGDSITEGCGASAPDKVYWRVLAERTGLCVTGYGVGGTRIARITQKSEVPHWDLDFNLRARQMEKHFDIIGIFGGTNDYGAGIAPLGNLTDTTEYTFCGALHVLFAYLLSEYPAAFVFAMTPLHRSDENRPIGKEGVVLADYADAIRRAANSFSVPVLDLYAQAGIYPDIAVSRERYAPDGLHPNDRGHGKIADMIEAFLRGSVR